MKTFIVAAALVALAAPVHAQTSASPPANQQTAEQGTVPAATKNFVTNAAITDMFEIQAGRLAIKKTDDPAYLDFAQLTIADHSKTSEELKKMVPQLQGVQLPQDLDGTHKAKIDKLNSLSGAAFERQYKTDQVEGHKQAIAMFQNYAQSGDHPDLKKWAGDTLPILNTHLQHAEALPDPRSAPTTGSGPKTR
jgi:putative membrane protein